MEYPELPDLYSVPCQTVLVLELWKDWKGRSRTWVEPPFSADAIERGTTLVGERATLGGCCWEQWRPTWTTSLLCAGYVGCRPGIPVTLAKSSVAGLVGAEGPLACQTLELEMDQ